jgi:hypothetical protein
MGYAVECALEACIAAGTREHDFPDRESARKVQTHDVELLLDVAGLNVALESEAGHDPELEMNWIVVGNWNPESRQDLEVTAVEAETFCSACTESAHGVLHWIKRRW